MQLKSMGIKRAIMHDRKSNAGSHPAWKWFPHRAPLSSISRITMYTFNAIITLSLLFLPHNLLSASLSVGDNLTKQKMGAYLDYYVDPSGKAEIKDIASPAYRDRFRPLPKEDYSFGYTNAPVWLRAIAVNAAGRPSSWAIECEYSLIDDICFYKPRTDGFDPICTGDRRPFHTRPVNYRTFIFPVDTPPGEHAYYIRLTSGGSLNVSFTAWGWDTLQRKNENESIIIWIFYGIMLSLFIYNLFIFISVRERSYLYLSLFTVNIALFSMCHNGLAFQHLWPNYPAWANMAHPFFTAIAAIFSILFTRGFLETRTASPLLDRILQLFILIEAAVIASAFLLKYSLTTQVSTASAALLSLFIFIIVIYLLFRGSRQARFYLTAWICFIAGVIMIMLHSFGIIHEGFLSNWGYQIGSSLVVMLLTLGIADKINIMRRQHQEALDATKEAENKYRALIETTDTGYVIIDDRGKVLDANAEYVRLTGHLTLDDIINRSVTEWTSPADRERNAAAVESCMRQGFIRDLEIGYIQPDGKTVPIEINATVIEGKEGSRILTLCRDITYRKTAFDNLQASLREKEVLLMEIHHRVKNNLQIISSLIALQAGKITDKEVLMLYDDLNSRIRAMSLIHERLYQSGDFERIDFAEYITIITSDLQNTYRLFCGNCSVEYDTDHIELNIVKAIPCGLMLNEIISNSFKYAFTPAFGGQGTIRISFHEKDNGTIMLVVSDNGVGLPPSVDPEKKNSLGLSLIYLLAEQIQGTISIDRAGGTKYTIVFSKA